MSHLINISTEQIFSVQVHSCDLVITKKSIDKEEQIPVTGIIIKPIWIEVKPENIRSQIVQKKDTGLGDEKIYNDLLNGIYYLNIKDYSEQEIRVACDSLTTKWTNYLWTNLIKNDEDYTFSIKDNFVLEGILKMNNQLFKTKNDFEEFCANTGLKIEDFIIPAKVSVLSVNLKEISLRLEMEQFFARKFLFTETLIRKIKARLREYSKYNSIVEKNINELESWITDLTTGNKIYQQYLDYQRLYEMPKPKIIFENNKNVNFISGDITDSKVNLSNSNNGSKGSVFNKRIKVIGVVLLILSFLLTIVIYWDKIIMYFQ